MARPLECVKNLEMPECLPESSDQPVPEVYLKSFFYFVSLDTKQLQQTLYTSKCLYPVGISVLVLADATHLLQGFPSTEQSPQLCPYYQHLSKDDEDCADCVADEEYK